MAKSTGAPGTEQQVTTDPRRSKPHGGALFPLAELLAAGKGNPWWQRIMDLALTMLVAVVGFVGLLRPGHEQDMFGTHDAPSELIILTVLAQAVPLLWRRIMPLTVFAVVLAACLVQVSQLVALRSDLSVLVCLYSVCRYSAPKRATYASLTAAGSLVSAAFLLPPLIEERGLGLFFLGCAMAASIALAVAARARQQQVTFLSERAGQLVREREQRIQLATAAERARVSRDMHDIVGHHLAVITGLADGASNIATRQPQQAALALSHIADTARQALSELRRTLQALRQDADLGSPDFVPQPGLTELSSLLERVRVSGPHVVFESTGNHAELTPGIQLAVYRIVQEALTNILKHSSSATTVTVRLRTAEDNVDVLVEDTGPSTPSPGGHDRLGLISIRERAHLAGGTAEAGPTDRGGWFVHAVFPLNPQGPQ
ncbi:sensor histidine kinase [Streptomyces sp. NPDC059396]|uniref:sensor histidine kinase n=1 Tax=Streptomyces sp. NPDC059396 TaxID=3346819 RepID=UPI0036742EB3